MLELPPELWDSLSLFFLAMGSLFYYSSATLFQILGTHYPYGFIAHIINRKLLKEEEAFNPRQRVISLTTI